MELDEDGLPGLTPQEVVAAMGGAVTAVPFVDNI